MKSASIFVFLVFLCFLAFPFSSQGSSYDLYVDKSYDKDDSDGSKDKPFEKISEAIEEAAKNSSGERSIFVKKGTYTETFKSGKDVKLYGENTSGVIISGPITLKDGGLLKNLTVTGGYSGVVVEADADATIDSCSIIKSEKIGINGELGKGKVSIINSLISGGQGKGIYIQQGRSVEISKNEISDNGEEGIDVRAKVGGNIKNNSIYSNRESGIEFIVGSADLVISGNSIKKNRASGIAAQFYSETSKKGAISIKNNTISKNKKFGLDCATPSGGNPSGSYWKDSIDLSGNTIEENSDDPINNSCHIIEAVDKEKEAVTNIVKDNPLPDSVSQNNSEEETKIIAEEVAEQEKINRETALKEKIASFVSWEENYQEKTKQRIEKIQKRGFWKKLFFGADKQEIAEAKIEIQNGSENLNNLELILSAAQEEESKNSIQDLIQKTKTEKDNLEKIVQEKEQKNGFFGWIGRIF